MKNKRKKSYLSLKRSQNASVNTIKILIGGILAAGILGFVGIVGVLSYYAITLPPADSLGTMIVAENSKTTTKFFDRTGKQLLFEYGDVRRLPVDEKGIPEVVKNSTVAVEDWEFYSHDGVTLRGMARLAAGFLHLGTHAGGSTITQQLMRNTVLHNRSLTASRKIQEILLALEIEQQWTKDQILTAYLNYNPYGGNIYGIGTAAQYYFGINDLSKITLAQAALLAGIPNSPTYYSPYKRIYVTTTDEVLRWIEDSPEKQWITVENGIKKITSWKKRQAKILLDMVVHSYITEDEAKKALQEQLTFKKPTTVKRAPHFVDFVEGQIIDRYADENNGDQQKAEESVYSGGLKIITSLDYDKQVIAEDILSSEQARLAKSNASNASLVSIDPKTGEILAMVGSIDYWDEEIDGQVNVVTSQSRQPGSAIKPFMYAYAFERGASPASMLIDAYTVFDAGYDPKNYDGKFHGPMMIREALANSYNIPAVKQIYLNGVSDTVDFFHRIGITTLDNPAAYGPAVALGGAEIPQLDMTYGFSVLANEGVMVGEKAVQPNSKIKNYRPYDPVGILALYDSSGKELYKYTPPAGKQLIDKGVAYLVSSVLSDNNARLPAFGAGNKLQLAGRTAAVKTGTTNDLKDITTFGYTPDLVTGVWVGNSRGEAMKNIAGSQGAAPIWNAFMTKALAGKPNNWYGQPSDVVSVEVCQKTGLKPADNCPVVKELFLKQFVPTKIDEFWKKYKVDKVTGKLSSENCPVEYTEDRFILGNLTAELSKWQSWVDKWFSETQDPQYKTPIEGVFACTPPLGASGLSVAILSPADQAMLDSGSVEAKVQVLSKSAIVSVTFSLDNQALTTRASQNPQQVGELVSEEFSVSLPSLSKGVHHLAVTATDQSGKSATSLSSFGVGVLGYVTIKAPASGFVTKDTAIPFSGSIVSNATIAQLQFRIDKGDWTPLPPGKQFAGTATTTSGDHILQVQAVLDTETLEDSISFISDSEGPTVSIAVSGEQTVGSSLTVSCSASDTLSGIGTVEVFQGKSATSAQEKSVGTCIKGSSKEKNISFTPQQAGEIYLVAVATDKAGNKQTSSVVAVTIL